MFVFSMRVEIVEHILLNIIVSHFIVEQDGNSDAKASVGDSLLILFTSALSILVIPPSLIFIFR